MRRAVVAAAAVLVVALAADVATTTAILAAGGGEANPLMVGAAARLPWHVAVKLAALGLTCPLVTILHTIRPWLAPAALVALAAGYAPILVSNARVLAWLT